MLDRTIAPPIYDAVDFEFNLPPINKQTLKNEVPLYWLNAGVEDVVRIDWSFPAGVWYEQQASIAHAAAYLLKSGTSTHTAEQINETLEYYGAELKVNAGNDFAQVSLSVLVKHLPALLPIVRELITDSIFPEYEVELYRKNSVERLMVNLRKCEFVANQRIDALLYGEDYPYGRYTKKENLEALNRNEIVSFYKRCYNFCNATVFMAGKIGMKEVKLVEEIFGDILSEKTNSVVSDFIATPSAQKTLKVMNDENGVQGAIRIGRLMPNRNHPDFSPLIVLNTLFGGYFGSRLMSNIREEKGYTYGIYSGIIPEKNNCALVIQTETGRAVIEDAVKEIYIELDKICSEPIDDEELLLVKNYLLGGLLGDLDGPFSILRRWRNLILYGFDEAQFNKNVNIYKSVTAKELQALAQKYFRKEELFEVVVI